MSTQFQGELDTAAQVWPNITPILFVPHTETEYNQLVAILNQLIDEVGSDESHPLASMMDAVGALVEQYDDQHAGATF